MASLAKLGMRAGLTGSGLPRRTVRFAGRRPFSQQQTPPKRPGFSSRLRTALGNSKVQWFYIPVWAGIAFLGGVQFYKVVKREREKQRREEEEEQQQQQQQKPKRRPRIRPEGPW